MLPETVDGAGCFAYFAVHPWSVLITEQDRCVSLSGSFKHNTQEKKLVSKAVTSGLRKKSDYFYPKKNNTDEWKYKKLCPV